jgi:prepilin-type N-terminal cleavage/methylation domain-containing protein
MTLTPSDHHIMRRARRAFTLLELVIVLGIILLLMGLVLGVGSIVLRQSEDRQIRATMAIVDAALVEFEQQAGREMIFEGTGAEYCGFVNCNDQFVAYYDIPIEPYEDNRFNGNIEDGAFGWKRNSSCRPWASSFDPLEKRLAATLSVLGQSPACAEIISKADPSLVHAADCVIGSSQGEPLVTTFNMKEFIDPWDKWVYIIFPGRRWFDCDNQNLVRDTDGTILTEDEVKYGTCRNRRPLLVSSGPDGRFGDLSIDVDDDNDGIPDHKDNVYSYRPEKP